jgi:hypothetical protein
MRAAPRKMTPGIAKRRRGRYCLEFIATTIRVDVEIEAAFFYDVSHAAARTPIALEPPVPVTLFLLNPAEVETLVVAKASRVP